MLHTFLSVKKSVAGELEVVQGALHVKEEWITTPAGEKAVIAGFRHVCLPIQRDGRSFDDDLPLVSTVPTASRALNAAQDCGLRAACERREAYAVRNIGYSIAIGINFDFVQRVRGEGILTGRFRGIEA